MWVLIAVNMGFWCSCIKETKEIAVFKDKVTCEETVKKLPRYARVTYICSEKPLEK